MEEISKIQVAGGPEDANKGGKYAVVLNEHQMMKKVCEDRLNEYEQEPTIFHGKTATKYIIQRDSDHWLKKRRPLAAKDAEGVAGRRHIEFAKNLFISWDDDGSGVLEPQEIIKPLISLGLSSDHNFAKKILQALDP